MSGWNVGDRVIVKPEFDEVFRVLGFRTRPGVVIDIIAGSVIVAVDAPDGTPGGGTSAPYDAHELEATS